MARGVPTHTRVQTVRQGTEAKRQREQQDAAILELTSLLGYPLKPPRIKGNRKTTIVHRLP